MAHLCNSGVRIESKYPEMLLDASDEQRLAYFSRRDLIVTHPALEAVLRSIESAADPGLDQNTILLVGPSGVGKTAATRTIVSRINQRRMDADPTDRTSIPAIWVEADAPERGNFDYKSFYWQLLEALDVPLISKTLPIEHKHIGDHAVSVISPAYAGRLPTIPALRSRVRTSLSGRNTELVAVDEAANLLAVRSCRTEAERIQKVIANANTVRSLVNNCPATLLWSGAFDLFDMVNSSGQLARRCHVIYFCEYEDSEEGLAGFIQGLCGLLAHLPAHWEGDISRMVAPCFEQSLGCIGIARTILHRWLKSSLEMKVKMDEALLAKCFFPKAALAKLKEELKSGRMQVDALLAGDPGLTQLGSQAKANSVASPEETKSERDSKKGKTGLTKPGKTAPNRRWTSPPVSA